MNEFQTKLTSIYNNSIKKLDEEKDNLVTFLNKSKFIVLNDTNTHIFKNLNTKYRDNEFIKLINKNQLEFKIFYCEVNNDIKINDTILTLIWKDLSIKSYVKLYYLDEINYNNSTEQIIEKNYFFYIIKLIK